MKYFFCILLLHITISSIAQTDTIWNHITKEGEKILVFTKAELAPQFHGGEKKLILFIDSNLNKEKVINSYKHIKGKEYVVTAYVHCIITSKGKVEEPNVTGEFVSKVLIEELIRVLNISPNWEPAKQNNRVVDCWIRFAYKITIPANEN